jgi:DNA helicase II / ATP-dependent DNA helicase PcrA
LNHVVTGHDGVFIVATEKVDAYVAAFAPQILRFDKKDGVRQSAGHEFGESKRLTFDRVMIPARPCKKMARHSLAFVHDGVVAIPDVQFYE